MNSEKCRTAEVAISSVVGTFLRTDLIGPGMENCGSANHGLKPDPDFWI